jgi:hypothetical protein
VSVDDPFRRQEKVIRSSFRFSLPKCKALDFVSNVLFETRYAVANR